MKSRTYPGWLAVAAMLLLVGLAPQAEATDYTTSQNGNWHDTATWGGGGFPNAGTDNVTIQAAHTVTVAQVSTAYTVSNLTVNGGLTHLANTGAVELYKINLSVLGDLNVAGAIDANAKGWATTANPGPGAGSGNLYTGSHGGEGYNVHGPTYGSITNPVTLGSAGYWNSDGVHPGGGAIRLVVSGASSISGTISANGKTTGAVHGGGAGGSVNLITGTLTGGGTISANATPLPLDGQGGGGGRVAVILTATGAGFGGFSGPMTAYSATARSNERGANGTVYRKAQAQEYGDLILDDNAQGSSYETIISTNVTDATVGNVTVMSSAKLRIANNASLAIGGSLTNYTTATFIATNAGCTVSFVGTATGTVYGSRSFHNLYIGDAGQKPLKFAAGQTVSVAKDLSMSNAWLRSTVDGTCWRLTVDPGSGTQTSIREVDVRNSDASAGATIEAMASTDSGINTNWSFYTARGVTNTWTGAVDSNWVNTNNWNLLRLPVSHDVVKIASGGTSPKLNSAKTLYSLIVTNGATLDLNGKNLTVQTNATISGTVLATGTETVTFQGDVDFTDGGLTAATSTVVLASSRPQTVTLDGTETFNWLRVDATNVTFNGGFNASRFICQTPGATLTFKESALYTISRLDLIGVTTNRLVLRSANPGVAWQLKVTNMAHVVAVDVARSDAGVAGGLTIRPVASVDSGNNPNWDFGSAWQLWTGASSTNFTTAGNWNPAVAPDATSRLYIESTNGVNAPVLTNALTVAELAVGGGGAALLTLNAPLTVTNDVRVLTNSVLTHAANSGTTEQYKLILTVGGNLYVDGQIDANAKGWSPGAYYGPGAASGALWPASHGGACRNDGSYGSINNTYGSVTNPVSLGSAGYHNGSSPNIKPGGGAILLRVSGASTIEGTIRANGLVVSGAYGGGSGGSVNLVSGTLSGGGTLSANSSFGTDGHGGGGGRVAVVLTSPGADFSGFTGAMTAYSHAYRSDLYERGAPGTVYRKAQTQEYGDLIVNAGAYNSSHETVISTNVTDAAVGNVTLTSYGNLRLLNNTQLAIGGSLTNDATSTFTATNAGCTVSFVGTTTGTVYGSRSFWNLYVGDAGRKPLKFTAGQTISVARDLSMSNAWLRSTVDGTCWRLTVDPNSGTQTDIREVDARNSDASAGATIEAMVSTDSGGNTNWSFYTARGETNTWTGAVDSNWVNTNNWNPKRLPVSHDVIRIASGGTSPKLNVSKVLKSVIVDSGATLDLNGKNLTVTTNATISGTLLATGAETVTFQGDVDFTLGSMTAATSTVVLASSRPQTVTLDGTETFNWLRVDATNVTFNGGFNASRFLCLTPGAALTFKESALYTISRLDLIGTVANRLVLRSSNPGVAWQLKVTNMAHVVAVDVARSDAGVAGGLTIRPVASVDSGNNPNWDFGSAWQLWTGASSTNFTTAGNWNPAVALDATSRLYIESTNGVNAPVLTNALTVAELAVGGGGAALLTLNAPLTVTNDVRVLTNSVLTHAANAGATEQYKLILTVGGNLYVDGQIDANAKGWATTANPGPGAGSGNLWAGSHGGEGWSVRGPTYGSVTNPVTLGSAGYWNGDAVHPGGGAIRLVVSGASSVSGVISANGKTTGAVHGGGAGGSVNLITGTISGGGTISANSTPLPLDGYGGGGGRVAVVLASPGADFSGFTGAMTAYSATARAGERGANGTVYRKAQAQEYGDLIINDNAQGSAYETIISSNVTDATVGNVTIMANARLRVGNNASLAIGGSLTNYTTATFVATNAGNTVSFVGTTTGTVYGSRTFCNLTIGGGGIKPLKFVAGQTIGVSNNLSINGAVLRSTVPTSAWNLTLNTGSGTQSSITGVDVQDSNAAGGQKIVARSSVDSGRNTNWEFIPGGSMFMFR